MSERLTEYLTGEAGEYLERINGLMASRAPDPEELLRLARGIRGSARLAGATEVSEGAERLEEAVRRLQEADATGMGDARGRCLRAVADLERILADVDDGPIPISALFHDDEGPHVVSQGRPPEPAGPQPHAAGTELVPVERLQYDGDAALQRAAELRSPLETAIRAGNDDAVSALLDELFDLIRLARSSD